MSRITGFVNVPVMPQSIGKIVRSWIWDFDTLCLESLVLSMFLWCHRALAKSWDVGFGILIPSTTKCVESLVLSMFPGDIGGLVLYLGFWGLDLAIWSKNKWEKNKEETVHCLREAKLSRFFFWRFGTWWETQWTAQKTMIKQKK